MSSASSASEQRTGDSLAVAYHHVGELAKQVVAPASGRNVGRERGVLTRDLGPKIAEGELHRRRKLLPALLDPGER
jgi:hypothetical protein